MTNFIKSLAVTACILGGAATAMAVPSYQIDIAGGTYDTSHESVVAPDDTFTVYALGTKTGTLTNDDFTKRNSYLSVALVNSTYSSISAGNYGSFKINGQTINVTSDMVYGVPPLESNLSKDSGDLPQHGIFPTYFIQVPFKFTSGDKTLTYNVQDDPGAENIINGTTGSTYYKGFEIDTSGLTEGFGLHFDLYNSYAKNGDVDVDNFAPFSHDAESRFTRDNGGGNGGNGGGPGLVPEPMTAGLGLCGLAALGVALRRRKLA